MVWHFLAWFTLGVVIMLAARDAEGLALFLFLPACIVAAWIAAWFVRVALRLAAWLLSR